jgi:hypothetical protein
MLRDDSHLHKHRTSSTKISKLLSASSYRYHTLSSLHGSHEKYRSGIPLSLRFSVGTFVLLILWTPLKQERAARELFSAITSPNDDL